MEPLQPSSLTVDPY